MSESLEIRAGDWDFERNLSCGKESEHPENRKHRFISQAFQTPGHPGSRALRLSMKHVTIYTDGSCSGNPGPGGWAAVLIYGKHRKEFSGNEAHTTNNRMELRAAVEGLSRLKEPCKVTLYTDSAYLFKAFTEGWIRKWQRNGWRTSAKKDVENKDLWEQLVELAGRHDITWKKVKGHADNVLNNRVDELAVAARKRQ